MLFRSKREGVDVDTSVGVASVVLEGLDNVEVRSFAFREAVLAVELQLGSDDRVLSPAVHVEGGLGKHEGSSIRESRSRSSIANERGLVAFIRLPDFVGGTDIDGTSHLEKSRGVDELIRALGLSRSSESVDSRRESINGIGVVEGLGTKSLEENRGGVEGRAVVDVGIRLDNPDELLARVVEVQLDLVGG